MNKNEIFDKTFHDFQQKKLQRILDAKIYLNSCYDVPEILELSNKLGELKIEIAKKERDGKDCENLNALVKTTKNQLVNLIQESGKDINKILPKFDCPICKDSGVVDNKICDCLDREYKNRLLEIANMKLDKHPTLEDLDLSVYQDYQEKTKLIEILLNLDKTKINTILFSGATGTGKTFIAKSLLKSMILKNNYGLGKSSFEVNNYFYNVNYDFKGDKSLTELIEPDVLLIDDLGAENMINNVTKEYLLILLNARQDKNKLTIFTSNLTLNDLRIKYNERFFSRLVCKEISLKYNFTGKDLRILN